MVRALKNLRRLCGLRLRGSPLTKLALRFPMSFSMRQTLALVAGDGH
jgi:hypothetical protein